jgi:predicted negative regulator of RcsB-dependent stress response
MDPARKFTGGDFVKKVWKWLIGGVALALAAWFSFRRYKGYRLEAEARVRAQQQKAKVKLAEEEYDAEVERTAYQLAQIDRAELLASFRRKFGG